MFKVESFPADDLERNSQLGVAYSRCGKMFEKLNRYEATAERSYYRAIRELAKVQQNRERRGNGGGATVADELEPESAPEIGSVPQNPPSPPQTCAANSFCSAKNRPRARRWTSIPLA